MSPVMALSVSRCSDLEIESRKAAVSLVSCIAVMVVTTLRGVAWMYSHSPKVIGLTELIKTLEFRTMSSMMSSRVGLDSEVEAASIASTKLPMTMAVSALRRSNARSASRRFPACL
ncbi:MAG: hypothetical protein EBZ36_12650 [Acidobacteria bacterium]|nr:hypothetical protein [Acidobacteriota bacterium]